MDIFIYLNRKFTRHDLSAFGSPNPDADPMLVALLADANDNGAETYGEDAGDQKLVRIEEIGADEVSLDLALYIAGKGEGCEVENAYSVSGFVEILDMGDLVPDYLPGYDFRIDDEGLAYPWTWGEWTAQPHVAETWRGDRSFIGAATFAKRSTNLTATEHLAILTAGGKVFHWDDLPAESSE